MYLKWERISRHRTDLHALALPKEFMPHGFGSLGKRWYGIAVGKIWLLLIVVPDRPFTLRYV